MKSDQMLVSTSEKPRLPSVRLLRLKTVSEQIKAVANRRENYEFLPAHLEILDTPPTPAALMFTWTLCAALGSALLWSCLAKIDIHAVAQGRVEPSGRSKVVQPFETSKVKAIYVENGARVRAGDILIELDSTDAAADLDSKRLTLEAFDAQVVRFAAAIKAIEMARLDVTPRFSTDIPDSIKERESAAMTADVQDYLSSIASLKAKLGEKKASEKRLVASSEAREQLVSVLDERAKMRQTLAIKGAGSRASVIDALQQVEQSRADLATDKGQLGEAQASLVSIERQIDQTKSTEIAKETQALAQAYEKQRVAFQDVVKAALRMNRMTLKAPIDGTVQQVAVTTVGQVVTAGQPLLTLVPSSGPIEIDALVLNQDVGFVRPDQQVIVKVDAFPFTRYGTIDGKVLQVSRDAIDTRQASSLSDAFSAARGSNADPTNPNQSSQNLVFPVIVQLEKSEVMADGRLVQLTPGMTVSVEIRTGSRRVIDYVLSPIRETMSTAGHER